MSSLVGTSVPYSPQVLINEILPLALRATSTVYASDVGASPNYASSMLPQYKSFAQTQDFPYIVAGILTHESGFNWTLNGNCPEVGPQCGIVCPKASCPGANSPTFLANYQYCKANNAPGITDDPVQSVTTCTPLFQTTRAQSLGQCLATYHLKTIPQSPFLSNGQVGGQLVVNPYDPGSFGSYAHYGINAIYNGPNYKAGAVNGFVAMLSLMVANSGGNPFQGWSGDGTPSQLAQDGKTALSGGSSTVGTYSDPSPSGAAGTSSTPASPQTGSTLQNHPCNA